MASIRNYDLGHPDDYTDEERAAHNKTMMLIADYLDRPQPSSNYFATHLRMDQLRRYCLDCGKSELTIHAGRLRCGN